MNIVSIDIGLKNLGMVEFWCCLLYTSDAADE